MAQEASSSSETLDQSLSRNLSSRLNAQAPEFVPTRPDPGPPRLVVPPPPPPPGVIHMFPPPFHVPPHLLPMHHPRMPVQFHPPQHFYPGGGFAEQEKSRSDTDHAYAGASVSPKNGLSEEPTNKVLNQVEYYFSDLNLATTDHLMRFIKKDPEGYVPISVVASFKKIKAAINSHSHLATILRKSSKLVVSEDGKKVRRLHPLTESDIEELQSRIVVAENLPEDHCHQNLMKIFSAVGSVKTIRTCPPQTSAGGGMSAFRSSKADNVLVTNKLHAYVEYESVELAEKAVGELNEEGNWRSGLRVRLMAKHLSKPAQSRGKKVHDGEGISEEEDVSTSDQHSNEKQQDDISQPADGLSHENVGEEHVTEKDGGQRKGRGRGRGKGRGRPQPHHNNRGNHVGTPPNNSVDGEISTVAKQPPGPRMPDGTRGFSMGRGKPVAVDIS